MQEPLLKGKKVNPLVSPKGLTGPVTDSEMQKVVDFDLKKDKAPGPDSFRPELIKTMPKEHTFGVMKD